mmetsp:Transcript_48/g.132  ORF Transcript_48/g.132 Transcript_48/m.132 type:complete len:358 (-) Transcript_48:334-1407(-)|eukprot:CAMPEP_0114559434 /NCGR_PEP_ID=MMETSP0114-20121206/10918_1 /TAXON_ID=31324 /ORGANISM="Goniomonas sp, Strain m" /LENGTH=357 /DNA_ID=CAMNT_0001744901 /DNA_START=73 /DNA_END=1146 /DNA_ORIENTATION=-
MADTISDDGCSGSESECESPKRFGTVRLLTLNVFAGSPLPYIGGGVPALAGSSRLAVQVELVRQTDPDVICLQEAWCHVVLAYYEELFPEYQLFFSGQRFWFGRAASQAFCLLLAALLLLIAKLIFWACGGNDPSWRVDVMFFLLVYVLLHFFSGKVTLRACIGGNLTGLAMLVRRRNMRLLNDPRYIRFGKHLQVGDWLNTFMPRGLMIVDVEINGVPLRIANTHLNQASDVEGCRFRLRQARQLLKELPDDCPIPLVLVGDFNVGSESGEVRLLCTKGNMRDAWNVAGVGDGNTWCARNTLTDTWYARGAPDCRIDYVFTRGNVKVESCEVALDSPPFTSDHFGVLVFLRGAVNV